MWKGRWLKARLRFPSILSGGKFSCSPSHDFRASEYRGQSTTIKKSDAATRTFVGWQLDRAASVILLRFMRSLDNATRCESAGRGKMASPNVSRG